MWPCSRKLKDGDIVNVDITVYLDGFHGDTSRTFLVGNVVGSCEFNEYCSALFTVLTGSVGSRSCSRRNWGTVNRNPRMQTIRPFQGRRKCNSCICQVPQPFSLRTVYWSWDRQGLSPTTLDFTSSWVRLCCMSEYESIDECSTSYHHYAMSDIAHFIAYTYSTKFPLEFPLLGVLDNHAQMPINFFHRLPWRIFSLFNTTLYSALNRKWRARANASWTLLYYWGEIFLFSTCLSC